MIASVLTIDSYIFAIVLIAIGLYNLITRNEILPSLKVMRAMTSLSNGKSTFNEQFVYPLAHKIEKIVKIEPYQRQITKKKLLAANIDYSPEFYLSISITLALYCLCPAFIFLPVLPLLSIPFVVLAVWAYFLSQNSIIRTSAKLKEKIESEIPKFTSAICQSITYRKSFTQIILNYRKVCSKDFANELDILLTDIKTTNATIALKRFENKFNSPLVNMLAKGLIGIERGDDMNSYMSNTLIHMKDIEIANLKKKALKRPSELVFSDIALTVASIGICFIAVVLQTLSSMHTMF